MNNILKLYILLHKDQAMRWCDKHHSGEIRCDKNPLKNPHPFYKSPYKKSTKAICHYLSNYFRGNQTQAGSIEHKEFIDKVKKLNWPF